MLLVLTGHAFVVSATHFHADRETGPAACTDGTLVGHFEPTETSAPAGSHEQCLLCRLQRNFVSGLRHAAPALDAPPAEDAGRARRPDANARQPHLLAPSGRAPPYA